MLLTDQQPQRLADVWVVAKLLSATQAYHRLMHASCGMHAKQLLVDRVQSRLSAGDTVSQ